VSSFLGLLILCLAGFLIYLALNKSGFFKTEIEDTDRNPWSDKKINIKHGIVSRGESSDCDAENFNLSKDDDVALWVLNKYPSKLKEPWGQEKKK
jgi:hypothetical protein